MPRGLSTRAISRIAARVVGHVLEHVVADEEVDRAVAQRQPGEAGEGVDVAAVAAEVEADPAARAEPVEQGRGLPRRSDLHDGVEVAQLRREGAEQQGEEAVPLQAPAPRAGRLGPAVGTAAELPGHHRATGRAVGLRELLA